MSHHIRKAGKLCHLTSDNNTAVRCEVDSTLFQMISAAGIAAVSCSWPMLASVTCC